MRLINADKLLMKLKKHRLLFIKAYGDFSSFSEKDKARVDEIDNCIAEVINASTIDFEDLRPKSEWKLNKDGSGTCKRCHRTQMAVWDYDNWQNYCGHCGAKMEVKE